MKNIKLKVSVAFLAIIMLLGCAGSPDTSSKSSQSGVPDFYLNPPKSNELFYGVGSAKLSSLDRSRTLAISRAREDIAFQMNAVVESAITDYFQEAGTGDNVQVISFVESISLQITESTLTGAETDTVEVGDDQTVYALVSYSKEFLKQTAADSFARNEEAAFSEFKAKEALDFLEKKLQR